MKVAFFGLERFERGGEALWILHLSIATHRRQEEGYDWMETTNLTAHTSEKRPSRRRSGKVLTMHP